MSLLSRFCVMCGTKHEYTLTPPNWCGSCGASLDGKTSTAERKVIVVDENPTKKISQKLVTRPQPIDNEEVVEIEEDNFIPRVGKLEINVGGRKKERLKDLAIGAKIEQESRRDAGPLVFENQEQFERDFKKLAGQIRK